MPLMTLRPDGAFQAANATLAGRLTIGSECSFWFSSVVRGDIAPVILGRRINVQDGAILHCDTDQPLTIEDEVSIGHRAIVHGAHIGRGSLIGMSATILSRVRIGPESMVAAGAVVPPNMVVPPRTMAMGVPARIVRELSEDEVKYMLWVAAHYVELAQRYVRGEFDAA